MNEVQLQINQVGCCEISSGTMRLQDTLPAMLLALKQLNSHGYEQCVMPACGFPIVPAHALEDEDDEWWDTNGPCVADVLMDALNEAAPDGFYFGTHEGDGASLGFWPLSN